MISPKNTGIVRPLVLPTCIWPLILFSYVTVSTAKSFIEPCATSGSCGALISYQLPSDMKIRDIAWLFSVDSITLFGTNNLDLSIPDPENLIIAKNETIWIPISCACVNGIRRGSSTLYTVKSGDTLSYIASVIFGGLVSYPQIADANQISDPNNITVGQQFIIPFPCACHDELFKNQPAMFLTYLVEAGETADKIAANFSISSADFLSLNNLNSSSDLSAGDVVEIPIHACTSSFRRSAIDYGLFIASGSYVITAEHCVQCSCSSSLQEVYCTPAPAPLSGSCPSTACNDSTLTIGQLSTSPSFESCTVTSCVYDGFKRKAILSSLDITTQGSCPASPTPLPYRNVSVGLAYAPSPSPVNFVTFPPTTLPFTGSANGPTSSVTLKAAVSLRHLALVLICVSFFCKMG